MRLFVRRVRVPLLMNLYQRNLVKPDDIEKTAFTTKYG